MAQNEGEIPLRRRNNAYYRRIFKRYDRDHDGFINVGELSQLIESREYNLDIPVRVVRYIHQMSDQDANQRIDCNEFLDMINNPDLVHRRPRDTATDGFFKGLCSRYPATVGMLIISIIQIIVFGVDETLEAGSMNTGNGPISSMFIYDPYKRVEVWRFITYMFVHIGEPHLRVNLLEQIAFVITLEWVHTVDKWWRLLLIYFAGVLAGSLATSIATPTISLAGASGGVYSLLIANIATTIMKWKEIPFRWYKLLSFLHMTAIDVVPAIYNRYVLDIDEKIGFVAHFAGALAGLFLGLNISGNLETKVGRVVWYASLVTYLILMLVAIIWNLAFPQCMT